jgi:hypothetical protein
MDFDAARSNLYAAARDGMSARFTWLDGEEVLAQTLMLERLLPMAAAGLARAGVDAGRDSPLPGHLRAARAQHAVGLALGAQLARRA